MDYSEFEQRRDAWNADGNRLMSREEVARFDAFFADPEESAQYRNDGFTRAKVGDFSQFETVEPMMKGYLGAKKCYDLYDRYQGNANDPKLREELRERLMEADLRSGLALGAKDTDASMARFMKDCERIANRETMIQTLEDPNPTAKLRLQNQLEREDPTKAQQNLTNALNKDLEQRVEMAKILFMSHLGKLQTYGTDKQPKQMEENMAEVYAHGGRTMFILPAGGNQKAMMDSIQGKNAAEAGIANRYFATHGIKPRTFKSNGSIASEATELKLSKPRAFSPNKHMGMNVSVGGLGQVGPNGKVISSDGTNGHMYMHMVKGSGNTSGMMMVGFENSGPGKKSRMGHAHDASAKKGGNSAFLSDKSYLGNEYGGRVVDLSGLSNEGLSKMLSDFEAAYRNAAQAAQAGNPQMLNACNELLTGKLMSVGQLKGMMQGLDIPTNAVEQARAGHPSAPGHEAIDAGKNPAVPMQFAANQAPKFRVTECEGLTRPEPPEVMKKPSRLQKLASIFSGKNSYVNKYKEYQQTLPARMETYKSELETYNATLTALEQGNGPAHLKAAYNRAIQQAERTLGFSNPVAPRAQAKAPAAPATSPNVEKQLQNSLLNGLFANLIHGNPSEEQVASLRNEFRDQICKTDAYKRLAKSGDANISEVMNNPDKMKAVLADVTNGILEGNGHGQKQASNEAPQRAIDAPVAAPAMRGM